MGVKKQTSAKMMVTFPKVLASIVVLLTLSHGLVSATETMLQKKKTYIIHMVKSQMPEQFEHHSVWYASSLKSVAQDAEMLYTYNNAIHGFSARLSDEEAKLLGGQPGILAVLPETRYELHTTRTPEFLGLDKSSVLFPESNSASEVIVGVLDTGVWPESKSFDDTGLGPIPTSWKGDCETGTNFTKANCNKKLVGARFFARGYESTMGPVDETKECRSPRDDDGHGTHTSSTAAGSVVENASLLGYAVGTARGMSTHARVAVYKVCWVGGCFSTDILAAIDKAIDDNVNVLSMSLGGGTSDYYRDSVAIGAFSAMEKGILVSCSAGNAGPSPLSLSNVAPWITTVGAGTLDRDFPAMVSLGNGKNFSGVSLYRGNSLPNSFVPFIYAGNASNATNGNLCMTGSLTPDKVAGKIVLCDRGINARVQKGAVVKAAGGLGMVLANTAANGNELVADAHLLPATAVSLISSDAIKSYLLSDSNPTAKITFEGTKLGIQPSPVVAAFSSRGPSSVTAEILKPDIIAPGVNILAAWSGKVGPTGLATDDRRVDFNIISGTSMSCPHVSGLAALLKAAHPDWSPAAIRSALMTTAYTAYKNGNKLQDSATGKPSTPYDHGSGHVDPVSALNPGLVYDLTVNDYLGFLCAINYTESEILSISRNSTFKCDPTKKYSVNDLNYPSFSVVFGGAKEVKHTRTLTNVGPAGTYKATATTDSPTVKITVEPDTLSFSNVNEKKSFTVTFTSTRREKRRPSAVVSDSGSSDELLMPSRKRAGPETITACNGLAPYDKAVVEDSGIPRKRERLEQLTHNEDGLLGMRGYEEREKKRGKLDVFDFDEYDGIDGDHMRRKRPDDGAAAFGERRIKGSMPVDRISNVGEYESGPSKYRIDGLNLGDSVDRSRLKMKRDRDQVPKPMLKEQYMTRLDKAIRVQGKSGVLKVLVNKKKIGGGSPFEHVDRLKPVVSRRTLKTEGSSKRNTHLHPHLQPVAKLVDRPDLVVRAEKSQWVHKKSMSSKESDENERNSENSDTSLKLGSKNVHARKYVNRESYEDEPRLKNVHAYKSTKRVTSEDELTPVQEKLLTGGTNEGKVKRGSGTEKQKLREQIRGMLLDAGWTIDYRPRKNRDYQDAVYINRSGTAYWSIIKAYEALQKQLNEDKKEVKHSGDVGSSFAPIADDVLSQLTRKTQKKLEKEMKKKRKTEVDSEIAKEAHHQHHMDGVDSNSREEKLNIFMKQGAKPSKSKMNENGARRINSRSHNEFKDGTERRSSESDSHLGHELKSREHSRCALLVRGSNKGLNSEFDDFVPYPGKRTILSWLIDSGTVQLSQKVQYRRRKRVLLEGWVTRDGIHCGCCSKILTVSKFEIHAGSKLQRPFQRIFLESGDSLLQCQLDAWNRQEGSEKIRFYSVDVDGDDPNDDTCGICGDGGDLICCDGCPSTFHLSCLDIEKLPPGEWHCPNCSCKFCGLASGAVNQEYEKKMASTLCICNLCEKKYHESCIEDMDTSLTDSDLPPLAFCGKDCKELFWHMKKYLGAKHELEAGFSWSLLHRTDEDSDAAFRGISQRVESNSKLAVGLAIMDECFLPIVDRRSGINLIQNILYNSGSNFNRLNYKGFYAAVLEKGDEIISIASIRFHGTKLAEMPFIGTRHIYRRQGMCRRLLSALESALCSLKVERLIIPAIAELMHTWTAIFGFTPLEESFKKEMRSMNMLVFPGVDMLQKRMNAQGGKQIEKGENHLAGCDVVHKLGMNSSYPDAHGCDDDSSQPTNENMDDGAASDSGFQSEGLHTNDTSHATGNLFTSDGTLNSDSGAMLAEYASHKKSTTPRIDLVAVDKEGLVTDSLIKENLCSSPQLQGAPISDTLIDNPTISSDEHKDPVLAKESACHGRTIVEADSDNKLESPSASKDGSPDTGKNRNYDSQVSASTDSSDAESSLGLVESLPPSVGFFSTSITKDVSDELNVSDGAVRGADESVMHVRSDLNAESSEEGTELYILSEATSFETHCEKAIDKSHGDPGNKTL